MRKHFTAAAALTLLAILAACSPAERQLGADPWNADRVAAMPAPQDDRLAPLFEGYLRLARAELEELDWSDAAEFIAKARTAAEGAAPPPFSLADRRIRDEARPAFLLGETEMLALLQSRGAQLRAPRELAQLQLDWDCWLQEGEEDHQSEEIALCRAAFDESLARAKEAAQLPKQLFVVLPEEEGTSAGIVFSTEGASDLVLDQPFAAGAGSGEAVPVEEGEIRETFSDALSARPIPPRFFTIYFDSGLSRLDDEAQKVVTEIIADVERRPVAEVVLVGHTDALGGRAANARLSARRARAAQTAIMDALGAVENVSISIGAQGELAPAVPDPGDERENRRVEVTVR